MIKETFSPEETFAFGKWIGEKALPGQVYTLVGDLGVGKTVFTQGVAEGLGITEPVNSPTFTIIQNMKAAACHFTTLMCTGSGTLRRWKRSAMMTISTEMESASLSGLI